MPYSHILWDFNGTLLNDVEAGIKSVNTLLMRRRIQTIPDVATYHRVFGFPIIDYYKRIGFDFSKESYDDVAVEWVAEYDKNSLKSELYPGITERLQEIKAAGIKQIVFSATQRDMLCRQLSELGIIDWFDEILGLGTIHAYSKKDLGLSWIERVKPAHAVLIGDTDHDFSVAKAMGIDCILVANGHNSFESLASLPCPVYRDIREVPLI